MCLPKGAMALIMLPQIRHCTQTTYVTSSVLLDIIEIINLNLVEISTKINYE